MTPPRPTTVNGSPSSTLAWAVSSPADASRLTVVVAQHHVAVLRSPRQLDAQRAERVPRAGFQLQPLRLRQWSPDSMTSGLCLDEDHKRLRANAVRNFIASSTASDSMTSWKTRPSGICRSARPGSALRVTECPNSNSRRPNSSWWRARRAWPSGRRGPGRLRERDQCRHDDSPPCAANAACFGVGAGVIGPPCELRRWAFGNHAELLHHRHQVETTPQCSWRDRRRRSP